MGLGLFAQGVSKIFTPERLKLVYCALVWLWGLQLLIFAHYDEWNGEGSPKASPWLCHFPPRPHGGETASSSHDCQRQSPLNIGISFLLDDL